MMFSESSRKVRSLRGRRDIFVIDSWTPACALTTQRALRENPALFDEHLGHRSATIISEAIIREQLHQCDHTKSIDRGNRRRKLIVMTRAPRVTSGLSSRPTS